MSFSAKDIGPHGLSVDVEEYFQVGAFEGNIAPCSWTGLESRVEYQIDKILSLFNEKNTKATFFCLGWIAEHHPEMIKKIADDGHEIACHGYDHVRVFHFDAISFKADLSRAMDLIEQAAGVKVTGYRAPSFSVSSECFWAYEVMADLGIKYSSSLYPVSHDHYGSPTSSRVPFKPVEAVDILEIPPTTARALGSNLPVAGGGYFRLFPYSLMRAGINRAVTQLEVPANFYFHPWEIDAGQPVMAGISAKSKFRHYVNLSAMEGKISRLLDDFDWTTMSQAYGVGDDQ